MEGLVTLEDILEENGMSKDALAVINQNLWQDIQAMPVIGGGN